jgi:3-hydroxy acid dehydrogenase/malonic semialdehyde reductase
MASMKQRLSGKTVLITGASSGIGCSTAFEFARTAPDIRLILAARRLEKLSQISVDIQKEVGSGVRIHTAQLDVSKPEEVKNFVQSLPVEFQDIDILVNNAYKLLTSGANPISTNDKMQWTCHGYSTVS